MNLLLGNLFETITEKFRNTNFWNVLCLTTFHKLQMGLILLASPEKSLLRVS